MDSRTHRAATQCRGRHDAAARTLATYGCLRTYAEVLGFDDQAELLQETLDEEKDTDESLTELAVSCINLEAETEDSDEEEETPQPARGRSK